MSAGEKRPWAEAMEIAVRLANELAPVCTRIKVAGSLRRRRELVGDIELVIEPKQVATDLMGALGPDVDGVRAIAGTWGTVMKSGGRMIMIQLPDGMMVDLYMTEASRWGSTLAIRTGPQDLGIRAMEQFKKRGLQHARGEIVDTRTGEVIPVPDEETYFRLAGLPCLPPEQRDTPAALKALPKPKEPKPVPALPAAFTPICRYCGCTDTAPCPRGCSWMEVDQDTGEGVCSNPECLRVHEASKTNPLRTPASAAAAVTPPSDNEAADAAAAAAQGEAVPAGRCASPAASGALMVVDGSNLAARAYHTMREPTLAELPNRFRTLLDGALRRWSPAHLIVALDGDSFRRQTIPGYKADRADREGPSTRAMTEVLRPAFQAWGVATREADRMEADDVIATLAANATQRGIPVLILTRDSDLLQLVSDEHQVRVLWPGQRDGGELAMDEATTAEYLANHRDLGHAFPPARLLDLRVLAGGKDGLPRVEVREGKAPFGFTTKRASQLLAAGVTLQTMDSAEAQALLKPRERTWWDACRVDALARAEELRLRTECTLIANDGATSAVKVRLSGQVTTPITAATKRMARCTDCSREIPFDPTFEGADRCNACAVAFGRLEAQRIATGAPRACATCGGSLDANCQLFGDGVACSSCLLRAKAGRAA